MKSEYGHKKITNEQTGSIFIMATPREQEIYLQEELKKVEQKADEIKMLLAKIRGKKKVNLKIDERPDEMK